MASSCLMPHVRGCGSCDQCKEYKARVAAEVAIQEAARQSIHEVKLVAKARLDEAAGRAKDESAARKARERFCARTPPKGHVFEGGYCVGCQKPQERNTRP